MGVLYGVLLLTLLVLVHEAGHMVVARRLGVRVRHFCLGIGSGPVRGLSWTSPRTGTAYGIAPLPIGGMVSLQGEAYPKDGEPVSSDPSDGNYYTKPYWKRALILVAGSSANLLAGWATLFLVAALLTQVPDESPAIGSVAPGGPAAEAGIVPGDTIVAYEDDGTWEPIETFSAITDAREAGATSFRVRGDGGVREVEMTPDVLVEGGEAVFGVSARTHRPGPGEAFVQANESFVGMVGLMGESYRILFGMLAGEDMGLGVPLKDAIMGPVGIVAVTSGYVDDPAAAAGNQAAGLSAAELRTWGLRMFLTVWAFIAVNLGIMNLLPLPPLDGGKLWEEALAPLLRRNAALRAGVRYLGLGFFILVFSLMLVVNVNDIARLLGA